MDLPDLHRRSSHSTLHYSDNVHPESAFTMIIAAWNNAEPITRIGKILRGNTTRLFCCGKHGAADCQGRMIAVETGYHPPHRSQSPVKYFFSAALNDSNILKVRHENGKNSVHTSIIICAEHVAGRREKSLIDPVLNWGYRRGRCPTALPNISACTGLPS